MARSIPIFLHIPKTGGTSVRRAVERSLGHDRVLRVYKGAGADTVDPDLVAEALADAPDPALISGHVAFGVHRTWGLARTYLTVVRAPEEQLRSAWAHYRRTSGDDRPMSVVLGQPTKRFDNPQVRQLLRRSPPAGRLDASHYRTAEANLRACIAVGTTERMSQTMRAFGVALGTSIGPVGEDNRRPSSAVDSSNERWDPPDQRMRWDRHLHRVAGELLDAALVDGNVDLSR